MSKSSDSEGVFEAAWVLASKAEEVEQEFAFLADAMAFMDCKSPDFLSQPGKSKELVGMLHRFIDTAKEREIEKCKAAPPATCEMGTSMTDEDIIVTDEKEEDMDVDMASKRKRKTKKKKKESAPVDMTPIAKVSSDPPTTTISGEDGGSDDEEKGV